MDAELRRLSPFARIGLRGAGWHKVRTATVGRPRRRRQLWGTQWDKVGLSDGCWLFTLTEAGAKVTRPVCETGDDETETFSRRSHNMPPRTVGTPRPDRQPASASGLRDCKHPCLRFCKKPTRRACLSLPFVPRVPCPTMCLHGKCPFSRPCSCRRRLAPAALPNPQTMISQQANHLARRLPPCCCGLQPPRPPTSNAGVISGSPTTPSTGGGAGFRRPAG
jgi:hypothetical protein